MAVTRRVRDLVGVFLLLCGLIGLAACSAPSKPRAATTGATTAVAAEANGLTTSEDRRAADAARAESRAAGQAAAARLRGLKLPRRAVAAWTILVYAIGDTDLEPFALDDVAEMAGAGIGDDVNVIVLLDRSPDYADDDLGPIDDFSSTKLLRVLDGDLVELADVGEADLGSPNTLAAFVGVALAAFPAERRALVLWDHGSGWGGMGPDETDGNDVLDLADIGEGIAAGLRSAKVDQLDLVGFDACLMSTYEVASVLAPYADYLLASEELEPGHGWDWTALSLLKESTQPNTIDLGSALIDGFAQQAEAEGDDEAITLALIDLGAVGRLQQAVGKLAGALRADLGTYARPLGVARADALALGSSPDPDLDAGLVDLGDLASHLGQEAPDLSAETAAVTDALGAALLAYADGRATRAATGLSIYFPPYPDELDQGYLYLAGVPHWADLLADYAKAGLDLAEADRAAFAEPDGPPKVTVSANAVDVAATLSAASRPNVVEATLYYGLVEGRFTYLMGEEPADIDEGSGLVSGRWDRTILRLSDGKVRADAYLAASYDNEEGTVSFDIPVDYFVKGTGDALDVTLTVVVDGASGEILSATYYELDDEGTYGEIEVGPGDVISPLVIEQARNGDEEWVQSGDELLGANLDGLRFDFSKVADGTKVHVELAAFDFGGGDAWLITDLVLR